MSVHDHTVKCSYEDFLFIFIHIGLHVHCTLASSRGNFVSTARIEVSAAGQDVLIQGILPTFVLWYDEARLVSLQNNSTESPHQPVQPPHCNGKGRGVHCVLRSGVEQRSFAHTVCPLGALPLLLGDVAQKSWYADDSHNTRAVTLG